MLKYKVKYNSMRLEYTVKCLQTYIPLKLFKQLWGLNVEMKSEYTKEF